eukprot:10724654-Ditylum_brightwellii.AAC.1
MANCGYLPTSLQTHDQHYDHDSFHDVSSNESTNFPPSYCRNLSASLQSLDENCNYDSFDDASSYASTNAPSSRFSAPCVSLQQDEKSPRYAKSDIISYNKNGNGVNKHALSGHRRKKKESALSQFNFDENGIGQSGHILSRTKKTDMLFR